MCRLAGHRPIISERQFAGIPSNVRGKREDGTRSLALRSSNTSNAVWRLGRVKSATLYYSTVYLGYCHINSINNDDTENIIGVDNDNF